MNRLTPTGEDPLHSERPPERSTAGLAVHDERALEALGSNTRARDPRKNHQRAKVQAALFGLAPPSPERIARYRILGDIGSGAMGEVLEAYDDVLTRKVAIKLVHRQLRSPNASSRMLKEARSLAQLNHPNVVQVYEAGMHGDRAWIAMEYIQGQNLRSWLENESRGAEQILAVFIAAGRGLAAAHDAGFVHRDFKPDNVLIDDRDCAKVVDFGLVRTLAEPQTLQPLELEPTADDSSPLVPLQHPLTQEGAVLGTPGYMSPEQIRGARVDARSDQFSFCAAAWFGLFGERPFRGASLHQLHHAMHRGVIEGGTPSGRGMAAVRKALLRGLSFEPEDRFPSMDALLEQLQHRPRHRWVFGAGVVALAGLLAVSSLGDDPCGTELAPAQGWSSEHASAIEDAFARTPATYASATALRVVDSMQRYSAQLDSAHEAICQGQAQRDSAAIEARLGCLEDRALALEALGSRFLVADVTTVAHAVDAAAALPSIERCITLAPDHEPLTPADPELRQALASAHAARRTGDGARAIELSNALMQSAKDAGDVVTEIDALTLRALARFERGEYDDAVTDLSTAIGRATAARLEERTTVGWVDLATHGGRDLRRPKDTAIWLSQAEGWVDRGGLPDQRLALALARGHYQLLVAPAGAYATFDALTESLRGRSDLEPLAAQARHGRSAAATLLGDIEAARRDTRWILDYTQRKYGPQHPFTASAQYSLGLALFQGGSAEAIEHYQAALATWRAVYPAGHPDILKTLVALADLELAGGRLGRARAHAHEALELQLKLGPEQLALAEVWTVLGVIQHSEGDFDQAAQSHRAALKLYEDQLGEHDYNTAVARSNLGEALVMAGRGEGARPYFDAAITSLERVVGPEHRVLAYPLKGAGIAALLAGELPQAIAVLERARALATEADPVERAEIDLAYAHALLVQGHPERSAPLRAEVQQWRATATELGKARVDRLSRLLASRHGVTDRVDASRLSRNRFAAKSD
ncbi:MAG: serine/threonine-protein kinase [Nannocystaceae bacterium]